MTQQYQQIKNNNTQPDPWAESENTMTMERVSVTLKESEKYDAGWIVIKGESATDALNTMKEINASNEFLTVFGALKEAVQSGRIQIGQHLGGTATEPHQTLDQQAQVAPPTQAPAPAQAAPAQPQYQQAPAQQATPQYQAPAPAVPQQSAPQASEPQGPFIPGLNAHAKYKEGVSKKTGRPYKQFLDPRPWQELRGKENTNDPNHPGLAGGSHQFMQFI